MPTKRTASVDAEPRLYELVGLVPGSMTEKQTAVVVAEVVDHIEKAGGTVTVQDTWAKRPLAYRIRGEDQATYYVCNFTAAPDVLRGLTKALRLESRLLRFLLTSMPEDYTYVSLAQLEARAAEAKEGLAPGLEPKRRAPRDAKTVAPKAKEAPAAAPSNLNEKLDTILKNLDENL